MDTMREALRTHGRTSGRPRAAILAVLAVGLGCEHRQASTRPAGPPKVMIAAAADLRFALEDIISTFVRHHPETPVQAVYGSSGHLRTQLLNKSPFDIYLSADIRYPRELIEQGVAPPDALFTYAVGRLVVFWPHRLDAEARGGAPELLTGSAVRRIAIAHPEHAPYGRAAVAALKHLGIYEQVETRLVRGDNVVQAAQFVESGAADAGILALSLASAPRMKAEGAYWEVPASAYPRLAQAGLILPWARDAQAARGFRDFLLGPEGQAILAGYGFWSADR